jgi:Na+/H+ antiporter NhaD/arsenite permease-like protein
VIAIVTVLAAFALGFFVRSRLVANTAYAVAYLWAFTFQTLYLLLSSLKGDKNPAFTTEEFPLDYGIVTLGIFLVGFGLVEAGHRVRDRRRSRTPEPLLR